MFVAVPRAIVSTGDGVGTDLYHTKGNGCTWEGLTQAVVNTCCIDAGACADKRIHKGSITTALLYVITHTPL
ncbi:hypothetical protein SDC9_178767 [bioreactor metagenome]|uniref:Uncharacterized protein n=1 Tax=bioreactor metagenome TaxID=1076179 RepID=A0A645H625_9ZZZZ